MSERSEGNGAGRNFGSKTMKYELILQDNKRITLTKDEADVVTHGILNKQEIFKIGLNVFKRTIIKGLFPIREEIDEDYKKRYFEENKAWHETCMQMSRKPIDDKVTTEITNRITPGLELNRIKLSDEQFLVMESNIKQFFQDNPKYPRCPMRVWWPMIADNISPVDSKTKSRGNPSIHMGKFFELIARNDEAISEWMKYQA